MADSDEEYDIQVEDLASVFDNTFQTSTRDPSELSKDIFSTVKSHQTTACAHALALCLFSNSQTSAKYTDTFVCGTNAVFASYPDANSLLINDPDSSDDDDDSIPFLIELIRRLEGLIERGMYNELEPQLEITPLNTSLHAALFSGSVLAVGLMKGSPIAWSFACEGLRLSDTEAEPERREVLAVGACLQLAIAGRPMIEYELGIGISLQEVVEALEKLKDDNVIRHPGGVRLLEATFALAKDHFAESVSPAESWALLFQNEPLHDPTAASSTTPKSIHNVVPRDLR